MFDIFLNRYEFQSEARLEIEIYIVDRHVRIKCQPLSSEFNLEFKLITTRREYKTDLTLRRNVMLES